MFASDCSLLKAAALAALALTASGAAVPSNNDLWKVPARTHSGSQQVAWRQLPATAVKVDQASDDGRLFSHYPFIYNVGGTLYLLFSASATDVDGMGQHVRVSTSSDAGSTWTKPRVAFPPALLPNQTSVKDSRYWCDRGIPQRALQPLSIVYVPGSGGTTRVFAVAQSSDNICPGSYRSAGRVARELNVGGSQLFKGDPCWIETNDYTAAHQWSKTAYGTQYHMKVCANQDAINSAVNRPDNLGPVATQLFNSPVIAGDGKHNVSYPTQAVWHGQANNGYWQRFWSDVSVRNSSRTAWVEYSTDKDGKNWYPATDTGSAIRETNIYQEVTKAHFGAFSGSKEFRYYVSNAGVTAQADQVLLTVATSRTDDPSFKKIGIVRGGDARRQVDAGTRPAFNSGVPGFYWPSAAQVGDRLVVTYSENRETIWVSVIKETDLP